jgi:hypothetical protein
MSERENSKTKERKKERKKEKRENVNNIFYFCIFQGLNYK